MLNKRYLDKGAILTTEDIIEIVMDFDTSSELSRLNTLEQYFKGNNININNRTLSSGAANNKLVSGFCRYITNTINGYFMNGKDSVNYVFPNELDTSELDRLFRYNDEPAVNNKIGENMSIYGYGIEQIYIDSNNVFRFTAINPKNVILLFEDNVDEDLHSVIKYRSVYIEKDKYTRYVVDYYTADKVTTYVFRDSILVPEVTEEMINPFGDVPFIYYENANEMGDFELRLSVEDSPNSAGCVIDAIRCCKLALNRGISGALTSISSYTMKHPPIQYPDDIAHDKVDEFIEGKLER